MAKTIPDQTGFVALFNPPPSVAELLAEVELEAKSTYPDHKESQFLMVKQRLVELIALRDSQIQSLLKSKPWEKNL